LDLLEYTLVVKQFQLYCTVLSPNNSGKYTTEHNPINTLSSKAQIPLVASPHDTSRLAI